MTDRRSLWLGLVLLAASVALASPARAQVLPYDSHTTDLENGLRLVTVPTPHERIVSLHIIVRVGSRDEVEAGRSGFAHFFEHMMFRGSKNFTAEQQAELFRSVGAERNAYTTDDYTCYHATFARGDLERVLEVEADRFRFLRYDEQAFRTEARAVLGGYEVTSASPVNKLLEVARRTAFERHPYGHTTLGLLADIEAMPDSYEYGQEFFARHYRPENTILLVTGDVEPVAVERSVRRTFGAWRPEGLAVVPTPEPEPPQQAPRAGHVDWSSPTQPWVLVGFKGPAFSVTEPDMAALDLLGVLGFGESSPLYERLFVRDRKVDVLTHLFPDRSDPYLVSVLARAKDPGEVAKVRRAVLATCRRLAVEPVSEQALARAKAYLRYAFAARLDSPGGVADALVGYLARTRSVDAVEQVHALYQALTPADVMAVAARYFVPERQLVATLAQGELPAEAVVAQPGGVESVGGEDVQEQQPALVLPTVLRPSASPLVLLRVLFRTGSADDPAGKEGVTALTAAMLARGGNRVRSHAETMAALFPMAASFDVLVDKEITVFSGAVHRDNVEAFYGLLSDALLAPAFDPADLDRIRANMITGLTVGLVADDEELGKEVLQQELFRGHPFGHAGAGRVEALRGLTVDDVRACYERRFHVRNVTLGLAGGYPESMAERVAEDLLTALPEAPQDYREPEPAPRPQRFDQNRLTIVTKDTRATGIHIGYPLSVTRGHSDWLALWLVRSYLGEHRSENGRLYQRLRELRGLSYGAYVYIEHFPGGSRAMQPPVNLARSRQALEIWLRPVQPENGPFALKAALFELRRLAREGMTPEAFAATRTYLSRYANLLAQTDDRRLGYALDAAVHGIEPDFARFVRHGLAWLSVEDVNRAIKRHLRVDRLQVVVVTRDAEGFRDALLDGAPTPPDYQGRTMPEDVGQEDQGIAALRVEVAPEQVRIVPVAELFR